MNDSYLEVLKQYEGEVTSVRRGRGAWICEYPDGLRLLKEYRGTVKRLEFEDAVLGTAGGAGHLPDRPLCAESGGWTGDGRAGRGEVYSETLVFRAGMQSAGTGGRSCFAPDRSRCFTGDCRKFRGRRNGALVLRCAPALSEEMARHSREMKRVREFHPRKTQENRI